MGRTGALIAPVVDHMAKRLMAESTRLYVDETTAPVLDPGKGKTKTGYLWAVLRDDRGWGGAAPPGVVFHYRPGRKGEYAAEILAGFNGTIQVDAYGGYSHLATPKRTGGDPLRLAFCWAHGRRKLIKAKPQKGSPIVDEALLRIAALYKVEDAIHAGSGFAAHPYSIPLNNVARPAGITSLNALNRNLAPGRPVLLRIHDYPY